MFRDEPVRYPDDNPVLGHILGIAIDVGPAMTDKPLKSNREEFDEAIGNKFGADCTPVGGYPHITTSSTM